MTRTACRALVEQLLADDLALESVSRVQVRRMVTHCQRHELDERGVRITVARFAAEMARRRRVRAARALGLRVAAWSSPRR